MRSSTPTKALFRGPIRIAGLGGLLLGLALLCGCGGARVTSETAFTQLKPKEQLPEPERSNLPDNLVVRVYNVADARTSYKNYLVLFINDHEVEPPDGVNNLTANYEYSLRLQEGVYEVRAEYHTVGGWHERTFKIVPNETVKVLPNQCTTLEAHLQKDERGWPIKSPVRFRVHYAEIPTVAETPQ